MTQAERAPRVSVITPVRNRRDLLAALLHALDEQIYDDFEVTVVDDGSTDGADELAERSLVHGRPIRVLRSNGGGAVVPPSDAVSHRAASRPTGATDPKSPLCPATPSRAAAFSS